MSQLRDGNTSSGSLAGLAIGDVASTVGLHRIGMVAWRDLDDPEAGGSELHASTIARIWSEAGLQITMHTSMATGAPDAIRRDGYHVERRSGRYMVFPRIVAEGLTGRLGRFDGLVEIWNGMPFFSPLWSRKPKVVFLHHVHAEMWAMALSRNLARLGWFVERQAAPPFYRSTRIITLSESSRDEIVDILGMPGGNVSVVPPGIDPAFSPGGAKSPTPLILAVGRLVPVKRFDLMIDGLSQLKRRHPQLRAVIVGEGYERPALEARVRSLRAADWIELPGKVDPEELVRLYRSAWITAACSQREGWGMTLTEAGACGTPAVASDIAGHRDAVIHGRSGFLAADADEFVAHLDALLADHDLREKMADGALTHAGTLTWESTARGTFEALAMEVARSER